MRSRFQESGESIRPWSQILADHVRFDRVLDLHGRHGTASSPIDAKRYLLLTATRV